MSNISITVCFPIRRALLRLAPGSTLPALQRECQLGSSAFPNKTDNLSMRCFSRKSKNCSFSIVTSWWEVIAGVPSTYYARLCLWNTAPALECLLPNISSTICFPIRRALLRLAPGSTLPALQRERQLRSSGFPNQTDNLSLRCFSRKSKNYSFSSQTVAFIVTSWWEVIAGVLSNPTIVLCLLPADDQLCLSTLHQHLSAVCHIFQAHDASPSAEHC